MNRNIKLYLAPMAGITDAPFRLLCTQRGADVCVSEMISAQGLLCAPKGNLAYEYLLEKAEGETELIAQLFGSKPEFFAEAANRLENTGKYIGIDINMGCPARKVTNGGAGSALMQDEKLAAKIVEETKKGTKLTVSVKMRLGYDNVSALSFAKAVENAGADRLFIHGRTRAQQYSGKADWDEIARVKNEVNIPVVANGDIFSANEAKTLLNMAPFDGLMIGRAALGNPWIFKQIKLGLEEKEIYKPSPKEIADTAINHAELIIERKGEQHGIVEMRKHFAWYLKGMRGAAKTRTELHYVKTLNEAKNILEEFIISQVD